MALVRRHAQGRGPVVVAWSTFARAASAPSPSRRAALRRHQQRRHPVVLRLVDVRARGDQRRHDLAVAVVRRDVQRRDPGVARLVDAAPAAISVATTSRCPPDAATHSGKCHDARSTTPRASSSSTATSRLPAAAARARPRLHRAGARAAPRARRTRPRRPRGLGCRRRIPITARDALVDGLDAFAVPHRPSRDRSRRAPRTPPLDVDHLARLPACGSALGVELHGVALARPCRRDDDRDAGLQRRVQLDDAPQAEREEQLLRGGACLARENAASAYSTEPSVSSPAMTGAATTSAVQPRSRHGSRDRRRSRPLAHLRARERGREKAGHMPPAPRLFPPLDSLGARARTANRSIHTTRSHRAPAHAAITRPPTPRPSSAT